jgi:hypothetical protein
VTEPNPYGLTPENLARLQELTVASLEAAVLQDEQAVWAAVSQLVDPTGPYGPREALAWVVTMLRVHLGDVQGHPGIAMPLAIAVEPDGTQHNVPVDEAPPGVRTYVRIGAAWANDDPEAVADLWTALVLSRDVEQILLCMRTALMDAAATVREGRAGLN